MSHFAQIIDGIVQQVIVAEQDFIDTLPDKENWIQTSYNTRQGVHYGNDGKPDGGIALRGNYAGIGYTYNIANDVFYPPRPFDINNIICSSWTIESPFWSWKPPIPKPLDSSECINNEDCGGCVNYYAWDEPTLSWVKIILPYPHENI